MAAGPRPLEDVIMLVDSGRFRDAEERIARALQQPGIDTDNRKALEFERERMRRILIDFSETEDDVKAQLRKSIPDLRDDEFESWAAAGLLEYQVIDGRMLYFNRAASNLFRLSPDAAKRRNPSLKPPADGPLEHPHPYHDEVLRQAATTGEASVAPRRVRVTQALMVNADAVPAGATLRAWIPYPRALPGQQEAIRFIESEPAKQVIAPASQMQRTVYLEKKARAGKPTKFEITYELTTFGQYHRIDPAKVEALGDRPDLAQHLGERPPHIVYTDALRRFSREVVGDERNPYRIAQKLFSAVDRIPWAGAREYSTISNISDYALHAGHADCGQQTLLLMTLLRLNGIPARWQSGMVWSDGDYDNLHDWGWLYLSPYGWVPMDVTTGRFEEAKDPGIEWFYLGGLDAYRIAFNDDYGTELFPPKRHYRSETVDSQRGEVEWSGGNLYFDQWDYRFDADVLPNPRTPR